MLQIGGGKEDRLRFNTPNRGRKVGLTRHREQYVKKGGSVPPGTQGVNQVLAEIGRCSYVYQGTARREEDEVSKREL